ncbi:MAG: DUF4392 domain-containing protein, partial [Dehalococcoidales bacterium]|nr:DUF4392 domain-containing protein [Dehalococcoidales bacterium]
SQKFARNILDELQPAVIISTERCGRTASGQYFNMANRDITDYTAKVDYLFDGQENTVGIGDGGNEIGMGNLAEQIKNVTTLVKNPAVTRVNKLIIASVSNWGAYGLIASLSRLRGSNLLPSVEWEKEIIREMVVRGVVDGMSGEKKLGVDGFDLEQNAEILAQLHKLLAADAS